MQQLYHKNSRNDNQKNEKHIAIKYGVGKRVYSIRGQMAFVADR
jgi:hypothetical protein